MVRVLEVRVERGERKQLDEGVQEEHRRIVALQAFHKIQLKLVVNNEL